MISRYGLLAKIIAHAPTRSEAAHRLAHALRTIQVKGLRTNRDFLLAILTHPDFLAGSPHMYGNACSTQPDLDRDARQIPFLFEQEKNTLPPSGGKPETRSAYMLSTIFP
jgi:acetyl/propionyl-CoA carboxylase alpha subunit